MPKTKNRGHRESRKPQQELSLPPRLGANRSDYAAPRKSNRSAAQYVANVGVLWDRRRAERKARKNALAHQDAVSSNPRRQHLDKAVREQMLRTMTSWSFDHGRKAFVANGAARAGVTPDALEQLLDAVTALGATKLALRVANLTLKEAARVRGYLGQGSLLVVVNHRFEEPSYAFSSNTRSR